MLERIAVQRDRQRESAALMSVRLESDDDAEVGGPPGVEAPDWFGVDGLVEWGREDEKSVMCVKV